MFLGVGAALGWNPSSLFPANQTFLLGDHLEADASSLLTDMTVFYMKAGIPVVLVSFREPFETLLSLCRRLGFDLNMLEARGLFTYLDGSKSLLSEDITALVDGLNRSVKKDQRCLIVLDEVSLFERIQPDLSSLFGLFKAAESFTNADRLIYTHEMRSKQYRWLQHRSSLVLEARPLLSGLSREFHGELVCKHGGKSYVWPRVSEIPFLFRSTEASIFLALKGSQLA